MALKISGLEPNVMRFRIIYSSSLANLSLDHILVFYNHLTIIKCRNLRSWNITIK
jgi:hypothetical protein